MGASEVLDSYRDEHPKSKERRALQSIYDISLDYDGYSEVSTLKELIDELRSYAREGLKSG